MSHSHNADANHEANNAAAMAEIKKVTILLSVLTVIELILGFWMIGISSVALRLAIKGVIIILMMAKAFYIVAYFMHLKHEVKNLIMTLLDKFEQRGHYLMIEKAGLYWHFVDLVWVFVFTIFYLL